MISLLKLKTLGRHGTELKTAKKDSPNKDMAKGHRLKSKPRLNPKTLCIALCIAILCALTGNSNIFAQTQTVHVYKPMKTLTTTNGNTYSWETQPTAISKADTIIIEVNDSASFAGASATISNGFTVGSTALNALQGIDCDTFAVLIIRLHSVKPTAGNASIKIDLKKFFGSTNKYTITGGIQVADFAAMPALPLNYLISQGANLDAAFMKDAGAAAASNTITWNNLAAGLISAINSEVEGIPTTTSGTAAGSELKKLALGVGVNGKGVDIVIPSNLVLATNVFKNTDKIT